MAPALKAGQVVADHTTGSAGLARKLAAEAGAKRLALFHHDPTRHDEDVDALLKVAHAAGAAQGVEVFAAHEGQTLELGAA